MKKTLLLFALSLFAFALWAQSSDIQSLRTPVLEVKNLEKGEKPVRISQVKVDVRVVGSLAVTTVDMTFHNPNNRIMEGELQFPLADGQSISRFALDINGKLREGVTVDKAKGQATFESTIRRKVDPALLEKTVGNNFRTRVYPLPAQGTRRVVIAYEQELDKKDEAYQFFLPIEYRDKLDAFDLCLSVFSFETPQIENTPWNTFKFDKMGEAHVAKYSAKDYQAHGQIVFTVPIRKEDNSFIENGTISKQTIFYTKLFPEITSKAKELPQTIDLYWDISGSMDNRNFALEAQLLDAYLKKIGNLTVNLHTFNCFINKPQTFSINNGNWTQLKAALENAPYDGATQFGVLDFSKAKADEIMLFSDGLSNFGKSSTTMGNVAITVVSSSLSSDHSTLKYQALATGGKYINLMQQKPEDALKQLMDENFRLISADYSSKEISNFTTSGAIVKPESGFSMAGKLVASKASVILKFGIGNKVLYTERVNLSASDARHYDNIVERVWAAKRISELDLMYEKNKVEVELLGKQYTIVTRNTSLIVLETVDDYLEHRITPPAELLQEYNQRLKETDNEKLEDKSDRLGDIFSLLDERLEWWNKKFDIKPKKAKKVKAQPVQSQTTRNDTEQSRNPIYSPIRPTVQGAVNGTVADQRGEALIGVNVFIKGTSTGTCTDVDGGFSINASAGETLQFSYIGFVNQEKVIPPSRIVDVILEEDSKNMDEVVVVGYGTQRRSHITGSISSISADKVSAAPIEQALQGKIAGLQVQKEDGAVGESSTISIRGASSISANSTPLYVVDGVVVDNISSISTNDIESISVIKDASATAIYGSRASNGVMIVTTTHAHTIAKDSLNEEISLNNEGEISIASKGITLRKWEADAPYMQELNGKLNEELYATYLKLRKEYKHTPSFFLDVATIFEERGLKQQALLILSNLAEINLQNYKLIRVLGHRLKQLNYTQYAINQFEEVLKLRPEEPQSYRDLALAYEQNKEYQKAVDLLHGALTKEWDNRFDGIEIILLEEMNHAIVFAQRAGISLKLKDIDERLIRNMPVDVRVVLNWDTDNSDMDLWVTDPRGEKCYYSHNLTESGGMISDDFTDGYGPEEFLIKKAPKGKYSIQANYYSSREQTIIGPTTIYLDIFTNYGRANEKKKTVTLRLTKEEDEIVTIGNVVW